MLADSHTTGPPSSITYPSVLYRDNFRIEFILASLKNLYIFVCDIGNAYLNAKLGKKLWTGSGTQFGNENGIVMVVARSIYVLKSSDAAWRKKLAETLMLLGYKSSKVDVDVWMRRDFKPNEYPYYKYMLCYVDDFLRIGFNPKKDIDVLNIIYRLK